MHENWVGPAAIASRAQDIRLGFNGSVLGSTFFCCTGGIRITSRAQSRWALFACLVGPGIQFSSVFLGFLGFQLVLVAPHCSLSLRPPRSDDWPAVLACASGCYVGPTGLFRRRTHVLVHVPALALVPVLGPFLECCKDLRIEVFSERTCIAAIGVRPCGFPHELVQFVPTTEQIRHRDDVLDHGETFCVSAEMEGVFLHLINRFIVIVSFK